MPIRMVKDDNSSSNNDNFPSSSGGGNRGGGGGNGLIGIILSLLLRNPKLLLVGIIIFGAYYFLGGQCNSSQTATVLSQVFNLGATLDPKVYDRASVYEPLADNKTNPLPESISLEEYCPTPKNQGQQGSCVGWGSTYAARTILEAQATGENPNNVAFSPSYVYNQIHLEDCQGSYINKAVEVMQENGALPYNKFQYTDEDCSRKPNSMERLEASKFKLKGASRLTVSGDDYKTDLIAIKQHLSQKAPVIIGMMVGGSFMQGMVGRPTWFPRESDYNMRGFGGHCMAVVGYDDFKEGGAFRIMNSWGTEWGENGFAWVRYKDFNYFCKEAYGIFPMGNTPKFASDELDCKFGLVRADNSFIPLNISGEKCITETPIRKGDKFKMSITNNIECYIYLFGEETDGSAYTLFPYTPKHSPYCGITGTRVFPKDYSMQADEKGTSDRFAIVITKVPIDYVKFNEAINASKSNSFIEKINMTIGTSKSEIKMDKSGAEIAFKGKLRGNEFFVAFVEMEKN